MKDTKVARLTGTAADKTVFGDAGRIIRGGGLVVFPTETVYGIGANGLDEAACRSIYAAKGRPSDNPLILTVPDVTEGKKLVSYIPPLAEKLMQAFWPGPLTVVLPRREIVPDAVTGGLDTVALRCPAHAGCREFLRTAGVPVAGPSANLSGRPSPTTAAEALRDMDGRVDMIIDGGAAAIGVESTIVEVLEQVVTILRPGGVTEEMLAGFTPYVTMDAHLLTDTGAPKAPGMKYRHYAPSAPMRVFVGSVAAVAAAMEAARHTAAGDKKAVGYLVSAETAERLGLFDEPFYTWGRHGVKEELAANVYTGLLFFDDKPVDLILAEGVTAGGIGTAVMNRLKKAAGGAVVDV